MSILLKLGFHKGKFPSDRKVSFVSNDFKAGETFVSKKNIPEWKPGCDITDNSCAILSVNSW